MHHDLPDNIVINHYKSYYLNFFSDCQYVYESGGMKYPGYYYIMIQPAISRDPFKVCCKMTNHSGKHIYIATKK